MSGPDEIDLAERLTAAQCLRNAHNHIAVAYSKIDGEGRSPEHWRRTLHETLDAVDWLRRALEHMEKAREALSEGEASDERT